ncbi:FAD-binding oxidoreductase [Roseateles depolymerans]|uniref:CDP-6-deoxy-L-threo-D-glycero-4-hexulose-3-dehydrase reductase n=1 Tax=Roseateles depolymerans TaxID=76731 RepID=A0A0U3E5C3_9BURK|nr:FAD-binding oxidoreductase [Roseateles depolymerans]ALV08485.1 CDP-6-deoxy-L-threo-D-glycero-4-hexulose-3-dehydrase reductase [Roseateles depolymerans]REG21289.1 CDP-4-dehydro-6-deoxyglucose reductase [Roseateles depolymerans]
MFAVTIANGKTFSAAEGESLLDAALRQHITLDYSCRTGRCSTCRSRVTAGTTVALRDETGLSASEKAEGFVLTCVRGACSDVSLDIEDLGDLALPEPKTVPCRIHALAKLSHDVVRVVLRTPPATALAFLPGQYIDVIGAGGLRRSYSVANAPQDDHLIELHIREVPGGEMSQYWFRDAKPNDLLRLRGPLGTFFLRGHTDRDLVFLATGTGIAPVKAMLEGLARADSATLPRSIHVYWGGRQPADLYWRPEEDHRLDALRPLLSFVPVLSRADSAWEGTRGHVQSALLAQGPDLQNAVVYACGSDAMIRDAQTQLTRKGLASGSFHSDAFVSSGAA